MTSLSRRKRPITAPRITRGRTICNLVGLAWLAAGAAVAADNPPPGLNPLYGVPASADLRDPATLKPIIKPPAAPTLYYQKDAAARASASAITTAFQPEQQQQPPTSPPAATLPKSATNTTPPKISQIPVNTEVSLQRTIVREGVEGNQSDIFRNFPADYARMTETPFESRAFKPSLESVEPMFVCYDRLYFEDKNSERYAWDIGVLQPFVSASKFYLDLLSFPYNFGTRPCQRYEANAGYCLPGDPVPYLIYPVELSVTGGLLEAGTVVGLYAIFP